MVNTTTVLKGIKEGMAEATIEVVSNKRVMAVEEEVMATRHMETLRIMGISTSQNMERIRSLAMTVRDLTIKTEAIQATKTSWDRIYMMSTTLRFN